MQDLIHFLKALRRPHLLIRAARIGVTQYRRTAHLRPLLGDLAVTTGPQTLTRLIEIEAEIDTARRSGDAAYSPMRHVNVLIAMMAEARALIDPQADPELECMAPGAGPRLT